MHRSLPPVLYVMTTTGALAQVGGSGPDMLVGGLGIVAGLAVAVVAIIAILIPVFVADWSHSTLGGWGVVTMLVLGGAGAYFAPPFTKELIVVLAWGMAFAASLLTRIAGHLKDLVPGEARTPRHLPEGGHYVSATDGARTEPTI